jgi:hypothetical protein
VTYFLLNSQHRVIPSMPLISRALFELVRRAVKVDLQELSRPDQDRLLTIDEVAQRLSVSKDWSYRNEERLTFLR